MKSFKLLIFEIIELWYEEKLKKSFYVMHLLQKPNNDTENTISHC